MPKLQNYYPFFMNFVMTKFLQTQSIPHKNKCLLSKVKYVNIGDKFYNIKNYGQKNSLESGFFYFKWSVLFETVSEKCQL